MTSVGIKCGPYSTSTTRLDAQNGANEEAHPAGSSCATGDSLLVTLLIYAIVYSLL